MLQSTAEVAKCLAKARESRERADSAPDMAMRQHYLDMESRWLLLARSHDLRCRLSAFADEAMSHLEELTHHHRAVPRVMCPECGKSMMIRRVEAIVTTERRADVMTFECECAFALQQTVDHPY